jgi:hypothetical protein
MMYAAERRRHSRARSVVCAGANELFYFFSTKKK